MKPTIISIDWDFFIYNGEFEEDIELPDGEKVPGSAVYHFGHKEGWTTHAHDLAWSNRVGMFDQIGMSLRKEYAIREDRGGISEHSFLSELFHRWPDARDTQTYFADSQKAAGELCRDTANVHGPVRVISFDAHHGLGYGPQSFKERKRKYNRWYPEWNSDDWLFAALAEGWANEAVVVYPDWRGFKEWQTYDAHGKPQPIPREHLRKIMSQIKVTTYSQYMQSPPDDEKVVANFIARSSGWTPPYLDKEFLEFVHSFNVEGCLDCKKKGSLMNIGVSYRHDNACQPRKFNYEEVLEEERDRHIVIQALQRAHALYAEGEVTKAEEIIKLCKEAGFEAQLDTWPKYQDSFGTDPSKKKTPVPAPVSDGDESYWDVEEQVWKSPWARPKS